jgi:NADH-quinone oxidoreductase subunit J
MTTLSLISFVVLAAFTLAGTGAAMSLRNPVHCILALSAGLVGLAGLFLQLGAQFVGFTQVMVYVGAVAILAVFAIMMTQSATQETLARTTRAASTWLSGGVVAAAVFSVIAWAVLAKPIMPQGNATVQPTVTVNQIGEALVHDSTLPLEIMGVLLTAALIGAVIVAMPMRKEEP